MLNNTNKKDFSLSKYNGQCFLLGLRLGKERKIKQLLRFLLPGDAILVDFSTFLTIFSQYVLLLHDLMRWTI